MATQCVSRTLTRLRFQNKKPPTAFRLFKRGLNDTTKGQYLFDEKAAELVMAIYERQGVELMIDLEHDSLSDEARASRADAADALGWYSLSLRNGELWAVNVRWNAAGTRRLLQKKQRYISPAFYSEPVEGGAERVIEIINAALCSMPATHRAPALVAASLGAKSSEVLQVRMTRRQASRFRVACTKAGTTPGALLRGLATLATRGRSSAVATASLAEALRLPPDSTRDAVIQAVVAFGTPRIEDFHAQVRRAERSIAQLARALGESPKLVK